MNPKSPIKPERIGRHCPVCKEIVYSRAGIHPQCAVRQSEPSKPKNKPKDIVDGIEQVVPTLVALDADALLDPPTALAV